MSEVDLLLKKTNTALTGGFSALSTSESLAVAIILNRPDWLASMKYSLLEAVERVGPDHMALLPEVRRLVVLTPAQTLEQERRGKCFEAIGRIK